MGRDPVRRHRRAADLHLPEPEVHRVPAQARVRPAHPRGRARGPPAEGRHADDGRRAHLHWPFRSPFLILTNFEWRSVGVFGAALACALLGFADDYIKLVRRRSLGLRARTKLIVTIAISLGLWFIASHEAHLPSDAVPALRRLPRSTSGRFYPVLIYLVVAGTTSAVNLTDGLDGLAAGCAAIVLLAYVGITFITRRLRPGDAGGLPGRCVRRLSVVQRLPGDDLHGRHGLARARRRRSPAWP